MTEQLQIETKSIDRKDIQSKRETQNIKKQDLPSPIPSHKINPQNNSQSISPLHNNTPNELPEYSYQKSYRMDTNLKLSFEDQDLKHCESACEIMHIRIPELNLKNDFRNNQDSMFQDKNFQIEGETGEQQLSCEEEGNYYKSLNQKFELALAKVSSKKSANSNAKNDPFMQRLQEYGKKRQKDFTKLVNQKKMKDSIIFKDKPLINSRSEQLISHYQPIQERYKMVIAEKIRKVQIRQDEKRLKQKQEQERVIRQMQQFQRSIRQKYGTLRTEEQYYKDMCLWNEQRLKNISAMTKRKQENITAKISAKPTMNIHSEAIMKKKPERVHIYEKEPQIKKLKLDKNYTFKPNLNKTMKK